MSGKKKFFRDSNYLISEVLGIILQIVPFIICLFTFKDEKSLFFGLIKWTKDITLKPEILSGIFAIIFYGIIAIRLEMFHKETLWDGLLSFASSFLNIMVIASVFSIFVSKNFSINFFGIFELNGTTILILGILFSLLSMRTISGYLFIIFLMMAIPRLMEINAAMGFFGALYVVMMAVSFFLQIPDLRDFSKILEEFKGPAKKSIDRFGSEILTAKDDASTKVNAVKGKFTTSINKK